MRISLAVLGAALLASPLVAQQSAAPFVIEETGQGFARLADAVKAVGDAQATIVIAPGVYRQCAVQDAGEIVYRAAEPGKVVFDGVTCQGKAALVLDGRGATVDGIIFRNMRVADDNGAGIRLERGDLTVVNAMFLDSQQGILSANDEGSAIRIDRSTFSGLGYCPDGGSCAHSIYVGLYGQLTVTRSRFERGTGGHYVKSRAARVEVSESSFDDSAGRATNYMIDLPAGATGSVTRNTFVQGRDKENYSAFVAVGAEDIKNSSAGLVVADNRASFAPGVDRSSTFVADWTHETIKLANNTLGAGLKAFETR